MIIVILHYVQNDTGIFIPPYGEFAKAERIFSPEARHGIFKRYARQNEKLRMTEILRNLSVKNRMSGDGKTLYLKEKTEETCNREPTPSRK